MEYHTCQLWQRRRCPRSQNQVMHPLLRLGFGEGLDSAVCSSAIEALPALALVPLSEHGTLQQIAIATQLRSASQLAVWP